MTPQQYWQNNWISGSALMASSNVTFASPYGVYISPDRDAVRPRTAVEWIPGGGSRMPFSQAVLDQKKHLVHMVGSEVFKFAVKGLSSSVLTALTANGMTPGDVDWVVPHQANDRSFHLLLKN